MQHGIDFYALEINVQHKLFEGVVLNVAQQHFGGFASQFHLEDGGVESLFFQCMPQCIVVEFDGLGLMRLATINDTGCATGDAQTAARTRTLLRALKSDKFHFLLLMKSTATSVTSVLKRTANSPAVLFPDWVQA